MNLGMTVKGAKELEKMLVRLEKKDSAKIARTETRKVMKTICAPVAKKNATALTTGAKSRIGSMATEDIGVLIAMNIIVRGMKKMHKGSYGSRVAFKDDPALHDGKNYIPYAIEYGHAAPGNSGGGKVAAPRPFMRKTFEETKGPASSRLGKRMVTEIERAAKI